MSNSEGFTVMKFYPSILPIYSILPLIPALLYHIPGTALLIDFDRIPGGAPTTRPDFLLLLDLALDAADAVQPPSTTIPSSTHCLARKPQWQLSASANDFLRLSYADLILVLIAMRQKAEIVGYGECSVDIWVRTAPDREFEVGLVSILREDEGSKGNWTVS